MQNLLMKPWTVKSWVQRRNDGDPSRSLVDQKRRIRAQNRFLIPILCALLFIIFAFGADLIPSRSMEPNLMPGDHVVIMRTWLAYPFGMMPARGDIITFHPPKSAQADSTDSNDGTTNDANKNSSDSGDQTPSSLVSLPRKPRREILIKRVIALPGETVQIVDGVVHINGKPLHEHYRIQPADESLGTAYPYAVDNPLTVPPGHLFVLGDNRSNSDDGRFWGTLDHKDVLGKFVGVLFHEKEIAEAADATQSDGK